MRILTFIIGFLLFSTSNLYGQLPPPPPPGGGSTNELTPDLSTITNIPKSPEVAAFEQYGSVPISMYTGSANVSIPIGGVQGRESSVPISMTYDAGGVRVEQQASWVGLGWNLNVGGVISRQVAGQPDGQVANNVWDNFPLMEYMRTVNIGVNVPITIPMRDAYFQYITDMPSQNSDMEPDLFSMNANGLSATFAIDYNTMTAYCLDNPKIKVTHTQGVVSAGKQDIFDWVVTNEDGSKYYFEQAEKTQHIYDDGDLTFIREYNSAWHLTKIISPNVKDVITFTYFSSPFWQNNAAVFKGPMSISTNQSGGNTNGQNNPCGDPGTNNYSYAPTSEYNIKQQYLTSIKLDGKQAAYFQRSSTQRRDIYGLYPLEYVKIYDAHDGTQVSQSVFNYGYFGNQSKINTSQSEDYNKLKLNSVSNYGESSSTVAKVYTLEYNSPSSTPPRSSFGMDYWGFYNGGSGNTLIPAVTTPDGTLAGADRDPSLTHTKYGSLSKIHYPTGGHTEFDYSLNYAIPAQDPSSVTGSTEVSETVINFSGGLNPANPYNYCDDGMVGYPEGDDGIFMKEFIFQTVTPKEVKITVTGTGTSNGFGEVIIYKAFCNGPLCSGAKDFCELFNSNGDPEIMHWQSYPMGGSSSNEYTINIDGWEDSAYRVLGIANGGNIKVEYIKEVNNTSNGSTGVLSTRGGLRTVKTIDRTSTASNSDAVTKYYYYGNLGATNANGIPPTINEGTLLSTSVSSGKEHLPLRFITFSNRIIEATNGILHCQSIVRHANNTARVKGPAVAYGTVSEVTFKNGVYNGFTVYDFENKKESHTTSFLAKQNLINGEVIRTRHYNTDTELVSEQRKEYSIDGNVNNETAYALGIDWRAGTTVVGLKNMYTPPFGNGRFHYIAYTQLSPIDPWPQECFTYGHACFPGSFTDYSNVYYIHAAGRFMRLDKTIDIQYYNNGNVKTESTNYYNKHANPSEDGAFVTRTEMKNSKGEVISSKMYYADDHALMTGLSTTQKNKIASLGVNGLHQIGRPLRVEKYNDNTLLMKQQTVVDNFGARVMDSEIQTAKGSNALDKRVVIHSYDGKGNAREVSKADGSHVVMLYGYDRRLPIAQIANSTHAAVLSAMNKTGDPELNYLQGYSDAQIRTEIDKIRNHSSMSAAQVTTFTHKPGVGMTSTEDPKGLIQYYFYDGQNRLEYVKDKDSKILSKNTYHLN